MRDYVPELNKNNLVNLGVVAGASAFYPIADHPGLHPADMMEDWIFHHDNGRDPNYVSLVGVAVIRDKKNQVLWTNLIQPVSWINLPCQPRIGINVRQLMIPCAPAKDNDHINGMVIGVRRAFGEYVATGRNTKYMGLVFDDVQRQEDTDKGIISYGRVNAAIVYDILIDDVTWIKPADQNMLFSPMSLVPSATMGEIPPPNPDPWSIIIYEWYKANINNLPTAN